MRRGESGFTLIEAIVALAVAVVCLSAFYRIYALSWRGLNVAEEEARALDVARNQLAVAGAESPLAEGVQGGETDDGYSWRTEIKPYESVSAEVPASFEAPAYWVNVRVTWPGSRFGRERSVELETLRLVRQP